MTYTPAEQQFYDDLDKLAKAARLTNRDHRISGPEIKVIVERMRTTFHEAQVRSARDIE